jgi:hypothetical protein
LAKIDEIMMLAKANASPKNHHPISLAAAALSAIIVTFGRSRK